MLKNHRVEGTCEWIKGHSDFQSWQNGAQEPLLWISGGPGKGKTFLSMYIAETIKTLTSKATAPGKEHITLEFYCNNRHESRNTTVAILKGLILNLLRQSKDAEEHLLEAFESSNGAVSELLRFGSLWKIFCSMLHDKRISRIYCILDGLDECNDEFRAELVQRLINLASEHTQSQGSCRISLLVTSRQMARSISTILSSGCQIQLDPHQANAEVVSAINQDLRQLINVKMDQYYPRRLYSDELWRVSLTEDLLRRSEGTFLWIGFAMEVIKDLDPDEIPGALDQLPGDLPSMYARILSQILPARRPMVKCILHWVSAAARPLTLLELYEATASMQHSSSVRNNTSYDEERAMKQMTDWVGFCANLLIIDESRTVNLVHQSAKDYLFREFDDEDLDGEHTYTFQAPKRPDHKPHPRNQNVDLFRFQRVHIHLLLASECISYIQRAWKHDISIQEIFSASESPNRREVNAGRIPSSLNQATKLNPLLTYAILHWVDHAKLAGPDIYDLVMPFLAEKSGSRDFWLREYEIENGRKDYECAVSLKLELNTWKTEPSDEIRLEPSSIALHIAARIGLSSLVSMLIEKHHLGLKDHPLAGGIPNYLQTRTKWGNTALMFAARHGHPEVVQLLISNGAQVNVYNKNGLTPLLLAGYGNQIAVIDLLLKHGAEIGVPVSPRYVPARRSSILVKGYSKIIEYLSNTKQNISVHMKAKNGYISLFAALEEGEYRLIELQLQNGANTNERNDRGDSILSIAAANENFSLVKLLLQRNADLESQNDAGETPLMIASSLMQTWERRRCIDVLIDHGANMEACDKKGDTALIKCARFGYLSNMTQLVTRGADIEARDTSGFMVLAIYPVKHYFDEGYHRIHMVKFLVDELAKSRRKKFERGTLSEKEKEELRHVYRDLNELELKSRGQITPRPSWM